MKFCQPIKPLELFTDEELTDAFCCGGQHQFAIEIFERWNKARAELAKAREAMRKARNHATPFSGSFRQWHSEIVGILDAALAAKGPTNE